MLPSSVDVGSGITLMLSAIIVVPVPDPDAAGVRCDGCHRELDVELEVVVFGSAHRAAIAEVLPDSGIGVHHGNALTRVHRARGRPSGGVVRREIPVGEGHGGRSGHGQNEKGWEE